MPAYCLVPKKAEEFIEKLKNGSINPDQLLLMTSSERREFFAEFLGEDDAKAVNALFESKLLLKNQKQGIISWAKKVSGITPQSKRDILTKLEKMENILNPEEEEKFLNDLADVKLQTEVTPQEAKKIYELYKKADELKQDISTPEKRIEYGNALLDIQDYLGELTPNEFSISDTVLNVANLPKTVMSTLDFSAPLRQGWGQLSSPTFYRAFKEMFKYGFSEQNFRDLEADIITRPTYTTAKRAGLRIITLGEKLNLREEAFMSSLLDRIPGIRGSERAYVGFLNKIRMDEFDHLIKIGEFAGEDIRSGSTETKDYARAVNTFTGSGNIGVNDAYANTVPFLNSGLFSPRKLSATVNMFNPYTYINPKTSKVARVYMLKRMLGSLAITIGLLGLAAAAGFSVETNPLSSDFGKVKNGKTRYDLTGGNGTYVVLLARLLANKSKSSTTGKTKELGVGYKPDTRLTLIEKYGRNKLSPAASLLVDYLIGQNSSFEKFDLPKELLDRVTPMIIGDLIELSKNDPNNVVPGILADLLGVGISSY